MMKTSAGPRDVVRQMHAYTLALRETSIKLNQNESPFDVPASFKREVLDRVGKLPWNRYPEFEATRLRSALATAYNLTPDSILAGNGSNELLAAAISTFVEPGKRVAIPRPTFALYESLVAIAGGEVLPIDFDPRNGVLPLDRMIAAVERDGAEIVIVCSPNNPTGGVLPDDGIERLLATGAVVLFDRAYGDFHDARLPSLHDRLVVFSTFSKAWGLAALRLGWLCSTGSTCREIRKVKLPYSLNVVSEEAAILALEESSYRGANVRTITGERERVLAALSAIDGIEPFPTRANFVTFKVEDRQSCLSGQAGSPVLHIFESLVADDILIRDVSRYPNL
jgi:histidinol-phosphate aminotransferase